MGRPYAELVNSLVDIPPLGARGNAPDETRRATAQQIGKGQSQPNGGATSQAQYWWLERMRTTAYPLEERMTLFWHSHFATSVREAFPDVSMMMGQNQTLRQHALGNFRDLVSAVTIDPAMLEWLDGAHSTIPTPNENFAREFFELFTLGKYPQVHDENDVREAARAFTGWTVDRFFQSSSSMAASTTPARIDPRRHISTAAPTSTRRHRRRSGPPVSARFIAYKLVANFAYVPEGTDLLTTANRLWSRSPTAAGDELEHPRSHAHAVMSDQFRLGDAGQSHQLCPTGRLSSPPARPRLRA